MRRVIPSTFWTLTALNAVLIVLSGLRGHAVAQRAVNPSLALVAIGMFNYSEGVGLSSPTTETGLLTIDLHWDRNRRLGGSLAVQLTDEEWTLYNALNFTSPRADLIIAQGIGDTGKFLMRGTTTSFTGGAQVWDLHLKYLPVGNQQTLGTSVTLSPFPMAAPPPIYGNWIGTFDCDRNPGVLGHASLVMGVPDDDRLSFQGSLSLTLDSHIDSEALVLQTLGTINQADQHIVMVGQGTGGRHQLTADGAFGYSSQLGTFADLRYRLLFDDRLVKTGAIRVAAPFDLD